jgi:lipopolysaccharide export system protein LptA
MNGVYRRRVCALVFAGLLLSGAPVLAGQKAASSSPLLPGSNSKDPISITADKLEYFDKEQKAIYTGNVVAVQGDSQLTCSAMTIFLSKNDPQNSAAPAKSANAAPTPAGAGPGSGGSQVKHMEAAGPVTVVSKTQTATGDRGTYDKDQDRIWLFGNVTLSDSAGNVTKGDKLTYVLSTGKADVDIVPANPADPTPHRVSSQIIPGSSDSAATGAAKTPSSSKGAEATSNSKTKTKPKAAAE